MPGSVRSIGVTPGGSVAFALTAAGQITAFDPRSGHMFGDVAGGPWSSLVAVASW